MAFVNISGKRPIYSTSRFFPPPALRLMNQFRVRGVDKFCENTSFIRIYDEVDKIKSKRRNSDKGRSSERNPRENCYLSHVAVGILK